MHLLSTSMNCNNDNENIALMDITTSDNASTITSSKNSNIRNMMSSRIECSDTSDGINTDMKNHKTRILVL